MKSRMIRRIKNKKGVITPFNLSGHGRRISNREYIKIMLGHLTTQLKRFRCSYYIWTFWYRKKNKLQ